MRSDAFRRAAETLDFSASAGLFTEDVVFRSPVVYRPYEGRDALMVVLGAVVRVFEDFRYAGQVEGEDAAVLMFDARAGERDVQGVDILKFTDDGLISELTVMVRPMSAMHALADEMKKMLEEPEARP